VIEVWDAFFVLGRVCLYDNNGRRIVESCIRRGPDLTENVSAGPDAIQIPLEFTTVSESLIWFSRTTNSWGHFLTEGIGRL
jgi:hypothetical protein